VELKRRRKRGGGKKNEFFCIRRRRFTSHFTEVKGFMAILVIGMDWNWNG
jgi:hypothetical protein